MEGRGCRERAWSSPSVSCRVVDERRSDHPDGTVKVDVWKDVEEKVGWGG